MAAPVDVEGDLPPGRFLPARDLLGPGLFCQAVFGPKHRLGAQVSGTPAGEEPHLARRDDLFAYPKCGLAHPGARMGPG